MLLRKRIASIMLAVVMIFTAAFFVPGIVRADEPAVTALEGDTIYVYTQPKSWSDGLSGATGTERVWDADASTWNDSSSINYAAHKYIVARDAEGDLTVGYCMQSGRNSAPEGYANAAPYTEGYREGITSQQVAAGVGVGKFLYGGTDADPNADVYGSSWNQNDGGTYGTYLIQNGSDVKAVRGLMIGGKVYEMTEDEARAVSGVVVHSVVDHTVVTSLTGKTNGSLMTAYIHLLKIASGTSNKYSGSLKDVAIMDSQDSYKPVQTITFKILNPVSGNYEDYISTDDLSESYVDSSGNVTFMVDYYSTGICNNFTTTKSGGNITIVHNYNSFKVGNSTDYFDYIRFVEGSDNNVPFTVSIDKVTAGSIAVTDSWSGYSYSKDTFSQKAYITVKASDLKNQGAKFSILVDTEKASYATPFLNTSDSFAVKLYQNPTYQDCYFISAAGNTSTSNSISMAMELTGSIKIHKYSSNPALTDGNRCYDLTGAVFGIYNSYGDAFNNTNAVTTITTDSNGDGTASDLQFGTYYVKEITAPKGYKLNTTIYTAEVNSTSVPVELNVPEDSYSDPLDIVVRKTDSEGVKLEGAEFTIKYYDVQLESNNLVDPSILGYTPTRAWVLKSDINGEVKITDSHKVSGDEFYLNDLGRPTFPIGTVTVQETKAPSGYVIDPVVRVQSVAPGAPLDNEQYYNTSTIPNSEFKAYIKIIKMDDATNKSILNNAATFKIWSYDNSTYVSFDVDGTAVSEFKTDNNGVLITPGTLTCGNYRIDEIECPEGYYSAVSSSVDLTIAIDGNYEQYVDANGAVVTDMGIYTVEIDNSSVKGYIEINKKAETITWDIESGKYISTDEVKSGVMFDIYANEDIYSSDGQKTLIYKKEALVTTITTDSTGYAKTGELPLGKYLVKESVPEGYIHVPAEEVILSLDSEIKDINESGRTKKLVYETLDINNVLQKAQIKVYKTDNTKKYKLHGASFELYEYDAALKTKEDYINKGVCVSAGVTDENGELLFDGYFPLGEYAIVERRAPEGYIAVDDMHIIEAAYDDSGIEYILVEDTFINKPIEVSGRIDIHKTGEDRTYNEELGEFENKDIVLEGIRFEIYASEDLYDKNEKLVYAADTLVETITTDTNGDASTADNLPLGKYRVHEAIVPEGYMSMTDEYIILSEECDYVKGVDENGDEKKIVYSVLEIKNKLRIPEIKTTAKDSVTLNNVADPSATTTSIDTISYTNLIPGKEYEIKTVLMDKTTKQPLVVDGKEITGTTKFKPTSSSGHIDVSVTYNSSLLAGKQVVFFEYVYTDGKLVALHAEIDDDGQTITYPPDSPPTGDSFPVIVITLIMIIAAVGIFIMIRLKKTR